MALKLKDVTSELRRSEKEHFLKVQEIHGEDHFGLNSKRKQDAFLNDEAGMQMLDEEDESTYAQQIKNREIQNLVNNINDLAVLFKELSVLVVE